MNVNATDAAKQQSKCIEIASVASEGEGLKALPNFLRHRNRIPGHFSRLGQLQFFTLLLPKNIFRVQMLEL